MRLKPLRALRPKPELAAQVASPPYDTVDADEAKALADGNPHSFLRIVRAELELPAGVDSYSDAVYAKAAANFARFQREGVLVREDSDRLYVYRQQVGGHVQRGIVGCCHIEDYESGVIRRHETTRTDKENDRTRLVNALSANSGPVFLTYRDREAVDRAVAQTEQGEPLFDFAAPDGVRHTVWRAAAGNALIEAFGAVPVCYVADGHHRAAAAVRAGVERRHANKAHTGDEEYNWFLAVLFPASQLKIFPYNRLVRDLNGLAPGEFLERVAARFAVEPDGRAQPESPGRACMYVAGQWYALSWPAAADADAVGSLDVSVLQERLLGPVLGVGNPATDPRIDFVGGARGTDELRRRVDSGTFAAAFSMHAVTVEQMMAVADAGRTMPPKSTWFEPKLRSGLLVHTF